MVVQLYEYTKNIELYGMTCKLHLSIAVKKP